MFGFKPRTSTVLSCLKVFSLAVPALIFLGTLFVLIQYTGQSRIHPINATLLATFFSALIGVSLGAVLFGQWYILEELRNQKSHSENPNTSAFFQEDRVPSFSRGNAEASDNGSSDADEEEQEQEQSDRLRQATKTNQTAMRTMVQSIRTYVELDMLELAKKKLERLQQQYGKQAPIQELKEKIESKR